VDIEWLILADSAQVIGGKLYVLGGGWETLIVPTGFPTSQLVGLAASFRVPWNETNQPHPVEIEIDHEDGATLMQVASTVEVGRPPGIPPGSDQRTQIAFNAMVQIAAPGTYVIIGRVGGEEKQRTWFRALAPVGVLPRPS
jgi:hypothetical protein